MNIEESKKIKINKIDASIECIPLQHISAESPYVFPLCYNAFDQLKKVLSKR